MVSIAALREMEALTAECEQDMREIHYSEKTRLPNGRLFWTLANGKPKAEGEPPTTQAETLEQALTEWRAGWWKFRAAHPGDVLWWRLKPRLQVYGGHVVISARLAILSS